MGLVNFLFVLHPFFPQGMFLSVFSWFFSKQGKFSSLTEDPISKRQGYQFFPTLVPLFLGSVSFVFSFVRACSLSFFGEFKFSQLSVSFSDTQLNSLSVGSFDYSYIFSPFLGDQFRWGKRNFHSFFLVQPISVFLLSASSNFCQILGPFQSEGTPFFLFPILVLPGSDKGIAVSCGVY